MPFSLSHLNPPFFFFSFSSTLLPHNLVESSGVVMNPSRRHHGGEIGDNGDAQAKSAQGTYVVCGIFSGDVVA